MTDSVHVREGLGTLCGLDLAQAALLGVGFAAVPMRLAILLATCPECIAALAAPCSVLGCERPAEHRDARGKFWCAGHP